MFEFTHKGEPIGKGRPRFYNGHAVTPPKTREYEEEIRLSFLQANKGKLPMYEKGTALNLHLEFNFEVPKSYSKKKRKLCLNGEQKHTKRPDIDNLVKAVLDALNGYLFEDDSQVTSVTSCKRFSESSGVNIRVNEE